jgi:hypothetical protein
LSAFCGNERVLGSVATQEKTEKSRLRLPFSFDGCILPE